MNPINITKGINKLQFGLNQFQRTNKTIEGGFNELVSKTINSVDTETKQADKMINEMSLGKNNDIHNTMVAMEKADISFQFMMQIRNKILSAYQEIYRMQI